MSLCECVCPNQMVDTILTRLVDFFPVLILEYIQQRYIPSFEKKQEQNRTDVIQTNKQKNSSLLHSPMRLCYDSQNGPNFFCYLKFRIVDYYRHRRCCLVWKIKNNSKMFFSPCWIRLWINARIYCQLILPNQSNKRHTIIQWWRGKN